jgi:hypothetical protein
MAREIDQIHEFERDPTYGLTKEVTVVLCDDGYIYEFAKAVDEPNARLVRGFDPSGELTHVDGGRLPSAVEETAKSLLGAFNK